MGENFNVLQHARKKGESLERVKGLKNGGPVDEECVHIEVGDLRLEGDMPQFCCRVVPAFQNSCFGDE